jgi:hypothetical protein
MVFRRDPGTSDETLDFEQCSMNQHGTCRRYDETEYQN